MRKSVSSLLAILMTVSVWAQPRFVPDTELIKLGDVLFQTPKQVTFGFTNKGNEPLLITEVHPSCGCVAVSYTATPVAAGERGTIQATYDARILGSFYRDIEVVTNASSEPVYLSMQGCVVTEVRDFRGDYPIDLGNVRLNTNVLDFGDVIKGEHPSVELQLVNVEKTAFHPELMHLPPYIKAYNDPESIPAGQVGTIRIELISEKLSTMGLSKTHVYLARYLGDKVGESNEIELSAILLPSFTQMNPEQLAEAPRLDLSSTQLEMGSFGTKDKLTATVIVSNHGKSTLHIHQAQVFNEALSVSLGNRTLSPGKSTKLKLSVSARKLKHSTNPLQVLLISNDPERAREVINITVEE